MNDYRVVLTRNDGFDDQEDIEISLTREQAQGVALFINAGAGVNATFWRMTPSFFQGDPPIRKYVPFTDMLEGDRTVSDR